MSLTLGTSLLRLRRYEPTIRWQGVTAYHRRTAPVKSFKAVARSPTRSLASMTPVFLPGFRSRALGMMLRRLLSLVTCCVERGKLTTLIAVRALSAPSTDVRCRFSR